MMIYQNYFVSLQTLSKTKIMDRRMKRQAALYMLITLVDEYGGSIDIKAGTIRRVFNDENQVVKAEQSDGAIALAADMDCEDLDRAVRRWIADNPRKFEAIRPKLNPKMMNVMVN